MICEKKQFESEIENLSKKYEKTKADPLLEDLANCITFSCIYAGKENAEISNVLLYKQSVLQYEIVSSLKGLDENKIITAQRYFINSYDKTLSLTVLVSNEYICFERVGEQGYEYKSEYFIDGLGNFVRRCALKQEKLNKKQDIFELSEGTFLNGVYFSSTYEKFANMKIDCFKLPNAEKNAESVYLKYLTFPDALFMCKTAAKFNKVPYLEILGMNRLADLLANQFEEGNEPTVIEDESFFDHLLSASKIYFYKKKHPQKKGVKPSNK